MFGISAVVYSHRDIDSTVLDLSTVLEGLVADRFEIIIVGADQRTSAELERRAPRVPLRLVNGGSIADGCAVSTYELILIPAEDGRFDVRELNHLLDAIEAGADIALGYRPHATDALVRFIQWCGWTLEVDCAFTLMRRSVWDRLRGASHSAAKRMGYRVSEVPVSHRRPTIGAPVAA